MPDASVRVYGIFERDSYTLTLGENLIAFSGGKTLDTSKPIAGDTEITVRPASGYGLTGEWSATEGVENANTTGDAFVFKLLKNTEISADVRAGTYQVTIPDEIAGGTLTVSGAEDPEAVPGGTELTFTAAPARGYRIKNWVVNGGDVASTSGTYTRVADDDLEVSAVFEEKASGTVTASVASGSFARLAYSIDGADYTDAYSDGNIKLYEGETLTVTATPGTNRMVSGWRIDGAYTQSFNKTYQVAYADLNPGPDPAKIVEVVTQSVFSNAIQYEAQYAGSASQAGGETLTAEADGAGFASGAAVGAGDELVFTFTGSG